METQGHLMIKQSTEEIEFNSLVSDLVFLLQDTEKAIQLCEKTVFARELDLGELYKEDKRTLGTLVHAIEGKAEIEDDFAETLTGFVKNRNILIHRAIDQSWWEATREKNFEPAFQFLWVLLNQTCKVKLVFESLIVGYARKKTSGQIDLILKDYQSTGYLDALDGVSGYAQGAIKFKAQREAGGT
jgi:hypothetical protein